MEECLILYKILETPIIHVLNSTVAEFNCVGLCAVNSLIQDLGHREQMVALILIILLFVFVVALSWARQIYL